MLLFSSKELLKDVGVIATAVAIGLCSNTIALQVGAAMGAGVSFRDLVKRASDLIETPEEIKNDNMYFLWRLSNYR
jgi:hypothetical protein